MGGSKQEQNNNSSIISSGTNYLCHCPAHPDSLSPVSGHILLHPSHHDIDTPILGDHLLHSGAPGRHGNQLLWSPWTYLEDVNGEQQAEENELQKRTRLSVYPLSVYPSLSESDTS